MQTIDSFLAEWAAAEHAGDTEKLERILTSDFTAVGPLGFILPKEQWLARHRQGDLAYESFALYEVLAREHGGTAVVTIRQVVQGTYQGHPLPEAVRATLTVTSDTGSWQLAAIHMSFIAGTPGAPPIPGASSRPQSAGKVA